MTITDTQQQLDRVLADLADLLDGIDADQADAPTPCHDWDVTKLRGHVLGWLTAFSDGFADPEGNCSDADAVEVEGTGADQVRTQRKRLATSHPDAASRPLRIGEAEMPGELALPMILWEYQVHGWDLATATGQSWSPADDGVEASLAFAPNMLTEDYQGEGKTFAPRVPQPDDAPALDRLVALSGRNPEWSAA